jgi:hypothetical protein
VRLVDRENMAATTINICTKMTKGDWGVFGIEGSVEMKWTCWLCSTINTIATGFNADSADARFKYEKEICPVDGLKRDYQNLFEMQCKCEDHKKNLALWLYRGSRGPTQDDLSVPMTIEERIFFSKLLYVHIAKLEYAKDRNEIKSLTLSFVLGDSKYERPFIAILDRLTDLMQIQDRMLLRLAVWKSFAMEVASVETIEFPATIKSLKEAKAFLAEEEGKWKQFLPEVLAAGNVHLVAKRVGRFMGWYHHNEDTEEEPLWDEAIEDEDKEDDHDDEGDSDEDGP